MMDFGQHLEEPSQPVPPPHPGSLQQQGHLDISDLEYPESCREPAPVSKAIQEVRVSSGREDHRHPVQSNVNIPQDPRGSITQGAVSQGDGRATTVTQVGNQAAHVSVPRPTPLVQNTTAPPQQTGQPDLTLQIAQLNKQHEEAQKRLQALLEQQQNQQKQRDTAPPCGQYKLAVSAPSQPPTAGPVGKTSAPPISQTQQGPSRYTQQQHISNGVNQVNTETGQPLSAQVQSYSNSVCWFFVIYCTSHISNSARVFTNCVYKDFVKVLILIQIKCRIDLPLTYRKILYHKTTLSERTSRLPCVTPYISDLPKVRQLHHNTRHESGKKLFQKIISIKFCYDTRNRQIAVCMMEYLPLELEQ